MAKSSQKEYSWGIVREGSENKAPLGRNIGNEIGCIQCSSFRFKEANYKSVCKKYPTNLGHSRISKFKNSGKAKPFVKFKFTQMCIYLNALKGTKDSI